MPFTSAFDALGFTFDVEATDEVVGYLDELFAAFARPAAVEHHYALRATGAPDHTAHELTLDGSPVGSGRAPEALVSTLVRNINQWAIGTCPHLTMHAGGVERDGLGVALPGAMEAGKTTLTAGLVRAGFGYLTDEALAIDRETLLVHPYPKPLSVDPGAWPLLPDLEPHADLADAEYKADQWQVPSAAIRPGALGRSCPVGVVVFPRYMEGAETALEPLGRAEALVELAKNTFAFSDQGRAALDVLAEVVRPAACSRLEMGELDAAVGLVASLVGAPAAGSRAS